MANPEHLKILKSGVKEWNTWRLKNQFKLIDIKGAKLITANLEGADLKTVDFNGVNLDCANLKNADLRGANLEGCNFGICRANLEGANLEGANLRGLSLIRVNLIGANLKDADLTDCKYLDIALKGGLNHPKYQEQRAKKFRHNDEPKHWEMHKLPTWAENPFPDEEDLWEDYAERHGLL